MKLSFFVNKSKNGDWFEYVHRTYADKDSGIKGAQPDTYYRLAVRKDYKLEELDLHEGDVLIATCDEAWVDNRPEMAGKRLVHLSNGQYPVDFAKKQA